VPAIPEHLLASLPPVHELGVEPEREGVEERQTVTRLGDADLDRRARRDRLQRGLGVVDAELAGEVVERAGRQDEQRDVVRDRDARRARDGAVAAGDTEDACAARRFLQALLDRRRVLAHHHVRARQCLGDLPLQVLGDAGGRLGTRIDDDDESVTVGECGCGTRARLGRA